MQSKQADGGSTDRQDQIYYAHAGALTFLRRISYRARRSVVEHFLELVKPTPDTTLLDVGTSDEVGIESNMLEQLYPYPKGITCASITEGSSIVAAYPGVRHVRIVPHQPLPFGDGEFDVGYSNAVLEHVGSRDSQRSFLKELSRVCRRLFIVVPNPGFPVEHHTGLPFVHWLPSAAFRAILGVSPWRHWASEENLNHISANELRAVWPREAQPTILYHGLGVGALKSNLIAHDMDVQ